MNSANNLSNPPSPREPSVLAASPMANSVIPPQDLGQSADTIIPGSKRSRVTVNEGELDQGRMPTVMFPRATAARQQLDLQRADATSMNLRALNGYPLGVAGLLPTIFSRAAWMCAALATTFFTAVMAPGGLSIAHRLAQHRSRVLIRAWERRGPSAPGLRPRWLMRSGTDCKDQSRSTKTCKGLRCRDPGPQAVH